MKKTGVFVIALLIMPEANSRPGSGTTITPTRPPGLVWIRYLRSRNGRWIKTNSYPPVREADISWSKVVWRLIDLREKINQPLFYPTEPIGEQMNLVDVLLTSIQKGELTAYSADDDLNEFKRTITYEQVLEEFDAKDQVTEVIDVETGFTRTDTIKGEIRKHEVQQLRSKRFGSLTETVGHGCTNHWTALSASSSMKGIPIA